MSKYTPFSLFVRQALLYPLTSPFLPPEDKVKKDFSYAAGSKTGSLVALEGLPKTGSTSFPHIGSDGYYQAGSPTTPRYTDNGDGTFTDNVTGLMFNKTIFAQNLWATQLDIIEADTTAGYTDWRMTNIFELVTLLNYTGSACLAPFSNPALLHIVMSSTVIPAPDYYFVNFWTHSMSYFFGDPFNAPAIAVRGGYHLH